MKNTSIRIMENPMAQFLCTRWCAHGVRQAREPSKYTQLSSTSTAAGGRRRSRESCQISSLAAGGGVHEEKKNRGQRAYRADLLDYSSPRLGSSLARTYDVVESMQMGLEGQNNMGFGLASGSNGPTYRTGNGHGLGNSKIIFVVCLTAANRIVKCHWVAP